jgi:hypothetical protein
MTIRHEYSLALPEEDEARFPVILARITAQYERVERSGVVVSHSAKEVVLLAITAIVTEPNRTWPSFTKDERIQMQDAFIDALAFNLLSLSHQIRKSRSGDQDKGDPNINIYDVIDAFAFQSWFKCCLITAVSNT